MSSLHDAFSGVQHYQPAVGTSNAASGCQKELRFRSTCSIVNSIGRCWQINASNFDEVYDTYL
jgi:hypothetical protein